MQIDCVHRCEEFGGIEMLRIMMEASVDRLSLSYVSTDIGERLNVTGQLKTLIDRIFPVKVRKNR